MLTLAIETYQRLLPEINQTIGLDNHLALGHNQHLQLPTVRELVQLVQPLPPQSCLVGLCEDGIPFLLDLARSETGSLLVTGDSNCEKVQQLQVMVESVIQLNSPHEVQVAILTNDLERWSTFRDQPHYEPYISGIYAWYEQGATDLINRLVSLGVDRGQGRHRGATILLIIDDLQGIFNADFEIQNGLHWLLEYGAPAHIRPVACLDAAHCVINPFWIDAFRTFLVGRIESASLAESLGYSQELLTNLIPGVEFIAYTGQSWLKYCIPTLIG
jgi:hypothetical protein